MYRFCYHLTRCESKDLLISTNVYDNTATRDNVIPHNKLYKTSCLTVIVGKRNICDDLMRYFEIDGITPPYIVSKPVVLKLGSGKVFQWFHEIFMKTRSILYVL
jgi:hypothetical protein